MSETTNKIDNHHMEDSMVLLKTEITNGDLNMFHDGRLSKIVLTLPMRKVKAIIFLSLLFLVCPIFSIFPVQYTLSNNPIDYFLLSCFYVATLNKLLGQSIPL